MKMTRGTVVLINDDYIYVFNEINGDMSNDSRGLSIIISYMSDKLNNVEDIARCYRLILKEEYDDDEDYYSDYEKIIFTESLRDIDFSSDYLYIVNNSSKGVEIETKLHGTFYAGPHLLTVPCFSYERYIYAKKDEYEVTLKNDDIPLLEDALDFYTRAMLGQYGFFINELRFGCVKEYIDNAFVESILLAIRRITIPKLESDLRCSYGVGCKEVDIKGRLAYEMLKTIMHNRAYTLHPEGGSSVIFNEPLEVSGLELPKNVTKKIDETIVSTTTFKTYHIAPLIEALQIYQCFSELSFKKLFSYISNNYLVTHLADVLDCYLDDFIIDFDKQYRSLIELYENIIEQIGQPVATEGIDDE